MTATDVRRTVRKLAWDIIPCAEVPDYLPVLGLVPGSPEGDELEHQASHARLDRLSPVIDRLVEQSGQASQVITAVLLRRDVNVELPDDILATVSSQNARVVYAGVSAILAQLLDDGLVQIQGVS